MNEIDKAEFEKWWMTTFHGLSTDETIRYRDVGKQSAMIGWQAAIKHERDRSNGIVQALDRLLFVVSDYLLFAKEDRRNLYQAERDAINCINKYREALNNGGQG